MTRLDEVLYWVFPKTSFPIILQELSPLKVTHKCRSQINLIRVIVRKPVGVLGGLETLALTSSCKQPHL